MAENRINLRGRFCTAMPTHSIQAYNPTSPDPITESWRWHELTEFKGLGLLDILERGPDDLWFASRDGLYHFDGRTRTRIDLVREDALPRTLELGSDGSVIVGTQFGISRIAKDGSAEKVLPVRGNVDCDVRDLSIDGQGRLWAATVWGLLRFERAGPDLRSESPTLYTSQDQAESLRQSAPSGWATLRTLDEHLLSVHTWMDGLGLRTRSGVVGHLAEGGAPIPSASGSATGSSKSTAGAMISTSAFPGNPEENPSSWFCTCQAIRLVTASTTPRLTESTGTSNCSPCSVGAKTGCGSIPRSATFSDSPLNTTRGIRLPDSDRPHPEKRPPSSRPSMDRSGSQPAM